LFAPLTQGGGGSRPEKLHLEAVSRERVPGNEEAEHGLLTRQPIVLAPGRNVGERRARSRERGGFAEQAHLAGLSVPLTRLGFGEGVVQRRDELGALAAPVAGERVACAGVDQRLEHALVAEAQVDAVALI